MKNRFKWWYGGIFVVVVLSILTPLASKLPDGLEKVASDKGFIDVALAPIFNIFPDYVIPGVTNEALAVISAGLLGTLILFGIGYGLARLLKAKGEA